MALKWDGEPWTGSIWFRIGTGVGACECNNEPSGSIQCGEFLVEDLLASQEGLYSMEFPQMVQANIKVIHMATPSTDHNLIHVTFLSTKNTKL
jgi:hypothetical protein